MVFVPFLWTSWFSNRVLNCLVSISVLLVAFPTTNRSQSKFAFSGKKSAKIRSFILSVFLDSYQAFIIDHAFSFHIFGLVDQDISDVLKYMLLIANLLCFWFKMKNYFLLIDFLECIHLSAQFGINSSKIEVALKIKGKHKLLKYIRKKDKRKCCFF